jgi:hypothetical protein
MVDIKKLDAALTAVVKKKMELSKIDYNHEDYDDVEEELHDLEDDLTEEFGDYLEDVLHEVHDEYCPDNDVLMPIAYLANDYVEVGTGFDVAPSSGVMVDADDFPGKDTRLVIIPNPTRIVLHSSKHKEVVWKAE